MNIQILTPEEVIFNGNATSVILPGKNGSFQLLSHHAAVVSTLINGKIVFQSEEVIEPLNKNIQVSGKEYSYSIKGGILEMNQNKVIILCD